MTCERLRKIITDHTDIKFGDHFMSKRVETWAILDEMVKLCIYCDKKRWACPVNGDGVELRCAEDAETVFLLQPGCGIMEYDE